MRLLTDSHVVLWVLDDDDVRLGGECRRTIGTADEVFFSPVTPWELNIKRSAGRLSLGDDVGAELTRVGLTELPITSEHGERAARLPPHHRDPFDRMLIAQAQLERLVLVSVDEAFSFYDVEVLGASF